jgi:glycosyltransferase involved in cell wall biosynthesis
MYDPTMPAAADASSESEPSTSGATATPSGPDTRVDALSYFFPAHNEADNIEPLVAEALQVLPRFARRFEVICVDDGSRDGTAEIADRLAAANPDVVRVVHHPTNHGYGAALRSGMRASQYDLVAFTDGDRQFRLVDLGRLLERLDTPVSASDAAKPDVVVGYRLKRADPTIRLLYARAYRLCLRLLFGLKVRDVDCACKLFRRDALRGVRLESNSAFLSAELLIKLQALGRRIVEVGVPHYPRTAGSASGANPKVVLRAVRDFWRLRVRLWVNRTVALRRGEPVLD